MFEFLKLSLFEYFSDEDHSDEIMIVCFGHTCSDHRDRFHLVCPQCSNGPGVFSDVY